MLKRSRVDRLYSKKYSMDTKLILVAAIALIVGAGGSYVLSDRTTAPNQHVMSDPSMMHGQMSDMMAGLAGKTGDMFDKAFISEMIVHHEGAIAMAEAALVRAEHEEIKALATDIISAQSREIQQMKEWQKAWYGE